MFENTLSQLPDVASLRRTYYNARIVGIDEVHATLRIMRIRPDWGLSRFSPGQYTVLGLGLWEPCRGVEVAHGEREEHDQWLVRRAYSFSSPILDAASHLVRPDESDILEFYIALVVGSDDCQPLLTPRLFALAPDDRLFVGPHPRGHYLLTPVQPDDDVILAATGTGEAPHNAMIAELLARRHTSRIVAVTSARFRRDLAYEPIHRQLERRYSNYRYIALTTREPENLDSFRPDFVGRQHLQEYFESGRFEQEARLALDPGRAHVFLCGNPQMVGLPAHAVGGKHEYPRPRGMVEVLERRGFHVDRPNQPGNVHFENYW